MKRNLFLAGIIILASLLACEKNNVPGTKDPEMVQVNEVLNLTPDFIGSVMGVEVGQSYETGDSLTLELTPGDVLMSGFYAGIMEHIHVHVGDTVYMPEFPKTTEEYVRSLSMKVAVPKKPFGIVVAYAVQQQLAPDGYTMRLEDNNDGIVLYGVSPEQKYKYFDCYLRTPDAYTIEKVEFKVGDGEWQDVTAVNGCKFKRTSSLDWFYIVSIRPDYKNVTGDVTLRVKGSQHARYGIKWLNTEYVKTDIPEGWQPNVLPEESIDGEQVGAQFYTIDGYYLDSVSSNIDGLELQCIARSAVLFEMPASDVEITLNFKKKADVSYNGGTHITSAQIYDAKDIYYGVPTSNGIPGEAVYLFVNVDKGFKPSKAYVSGSDTGYDFVIYGDGIDKYQYYAEVVLPESDGPFELMSEVVKSYVASGSNILFDGGHDYAEGELVSFQVYVPSGKTLSGVKVTSSDGKEIECTMDNTKGSFVMPACDVTVVADYADTDPGTIAHISAIYDADEYSVFSQTNPYYQRITSDGLGVPAGTTLYINITSNYGNPFWVGVKIGETVNYYKATEDPDYGDVSFGKSFVFSADAVIKVGSSEDSVKF